MAGRAKLKKGNIVLFFLLILGLLYFFNREQINKDLEDMGILPVVEEVAETEENLEEVPAIEENTAEESTDNATTEEVASKEPTFQILTKGGADELYIGENPIRIQTLGIEVGKVTPIPEGSGIDIKTIDRERGLYNVVVQRKGNAKINLFAKTEGKKGKYGVVASKTFRVFPKPPPSVNAPPVNNELDDLLWSITPLSGEDGILQFGQDNELEVAIAEVDPRTIRLQISGEGNSISPLDPNKGKFKANIKSGKRVTITVRAKVGGSPQIVGTKDFVVNGNPNANDEETSSNNNQTADNAPKTEKSDVILYVGVDYPFNIDDPSVDTKFIQFKGENVRVVGNNGKYVMNVTKAGEAKVSIMNTKSGSPQLMETTIYETRELPPPTAMIDGKSSGELTIAKMRDTKNLEFGYTDLDVDVNFQLIRCKVTRYPADAAPESQLNSGNVFTNSTRRLFMEAQAGDLYRITDIKVKTPNHKFLEVKSISFEVR